MPMYCPKCQRLYENGPHYQNRLLSRLWEIYRPEYRKMRENGLLCEKCRFSRLREAKPNDPVRLIRTDWLRAEMLEPLLRDAEIPYSRLGKISGALGMSAGMSLDEISFVVPYAALDEARALCAVLNPLSGEEAQNTQDQKE